MRWQLVAKEQPPEWFTTAVKAYTPNSDGNFASQLLWQRGVREIEQLPAFVNPSCYSPTSSDAFGKEMCQ